MALLKTRGGGPDRIRKITADAVVQYVVQRLAAATAHVPLSALQRYNGWGMLPTLNMNERTPANVDWYAIGYWQSGFHYP